MSVVQTNPEIAKERAKWEQHPTEFTLGGLRPGNPYVYRPFPKMLYKARQIPPGMDGAGKHATSLSAPAFFGFRDQNEWQRACEGAYNFTKSCQMEVKDEREYDNMVKDGWRDGPQEAMAYAEALQNAVSNAAAERAHADRNMGEKAKAESAAFEEENFGHQPEIPAKPKRKYVRKSA